MRSFLQILIVKLSRSSWLDSENILPTFVLAVTYRFRGYFSFTSALDCRRTGFWQTSFCRILACSVFFLDKHNSALISFAKINDEKVYLSSYVQFMLVCHIQDQE